MRRVSVRVRFAAVFVAFLLFPICASSEELAGLSRSTSLAPRIEVLSSGLQEVRLRLTMDWAALSFMTDFGAGVEGLQGRTISEQTTQPQTTFFVAIAHTGTPELEVVSWNTVTAPVSLTSLTNEMGVGESVRLGEPAVLREARIVPVTVFPMQYESGAEEAEVLESAEIIIRTGTDLGVNPLLNARGRVSRSWIPVYRSVIVNWQNIDGLDSPEEPHIVLIAPGNFVSALSEFVDWKEKAGYVVTVIREGDIGSNPNADVLRTYIMGLYDTLTPTPDYIIFVGDESQLAYYLRYTPDPTTIFSNYSHPDYYSDENYFVAIEGNDVFPDLFFGRWVVSTTEEVMKIARRTIYHERNPFGTGPVPSDSVRFAKASMASDVTELSQAQTKRYVRQMLLDHGFAQVDTFFGYDSPQPFIACIREGRNFANYRGAGWSQGWQGIHFDITDIPTLDNYWKLPIVTGIGCGVARFQDPGPCFGSVWMIEGTLNQPEGSVGFLGPCSNTHTRYNDVLDSALYRAILYNEVSHLMPAFVAGKLMFWQVFQPYFVIDPGVQEVTETAIRQYLNLSDPSLQLYTRIPQRLTVNHPPSISYGDVNFVVNVPNLAALRLDSVKVCAWIESGDFVFGWATPQQANVVLPMTIPISSNGIWLTVTGDNVLTYQTEIPIGPPGEYVVHNRVFLADTIVGNRNGLVEPGETVVWEEEGMNLGLLDARDVAAALQCQDLRVTISQSASAFGDIVSLDSARGSPPFAFSIVDTCKTATALPFQILWTASEAGPWTSNVLISLVVPDIRLVSLAVTDLSGGTWDRGEPAKVSVEVTNSGGAPLVPGQYILRVDDPLVTVTDSVASGEGIQPGDTLSLGDMAFQMLAAPNTPAAHPVALTIHVVADQGTYVHENDMFASAVVGVVTASDPFSDMQGRYWAYDLGDTLYTERPTFDWFEIAPLAGGPGDTIGFTRSDQTLPVLVPFSYDFYGITFDSLSISTDGWVHPGWTTQTDRSNSVLPDPTLSNPDGLIAVFWDDLWYRDGETGQIAYYYDANGDRFIVEWYHIHTYGDTVRTMTFQLQLLNPASHSTPTGDAIWLLLYAQILASNVRTATVGMEDPTSTDGITYENNGDYAQGAVTVQNGRIIKFTTEPPLILAVERTRAGIPTEFRMSQNYPNPFNPQTTIELALPRSSRVTLTVYNLLGQRVATLTDAVLPAGVHPIRWNGEDCFGKTVGSGIYIYRAETEYGNLARKMVLIR
ncbi:MAG: C25 family cysteine peptidase [bacterium]